MTCMFDSKSSSLHSTGAFEIYPRDIFADSNPISFTTSNIFPASDGSTNIIELPSSSPSSKKKSSMSASIAASSKASSSTTASATSIFPFLSYRNRTDPDSAIFALRLFTVDFTSALARLGLSDRTLMTMEAPPKPYASNVDSAKSAVFASLALLMARLMLSTGTLLAFACFTTSARDLFESVEADPPAFTAMMILFPKRAFVLAFLRSVFDFVAARTAAARPMNNGPVRRGCCCCCCCCCGAALVVVAIPDSGEKPDVSPVEQRRAVSDTKAICIFIVLGS
mmetsp:Transcript_23378/g.55345  ORF Transcript_23378/g.55345 Transcript_23378/m.55345 type:complete len:282 (+) Transcript_23378:159-1004(+)